MCEKQCRDENGFKCHLSSEAHARQMALFGEDPAAAVASFSEAFQASFLELMRTRHPASRVDSHIVYNELVADRGHIHMNATVWHTLTDFVKHLGRAGLCRVDQDDKGHWWVALAAADAAAASAAASKAKRERADAEEAAREAAALRAQVAAAARAAAAAAGEGGGAPGAPAADRPSSQLVRGEGDAPIRLAVPSRAAPGAAGGGGGGGPPPPRPAVFGAGAGAGAGARPAAPATAPRPSVAAALMEREQAAKRARVAAPQAPPPPPPAAAAAAVDDDAPWARPGIVVKLVAPALQGGPFWKAKGEVVAVSGGGYVAEVEAPDGGGGVAVLRVDQAHCETVLPGPGGRVVVVRGRAAGVAGTLEEIDERGFRARVALDGGEGGGGGPSSGWFEYEDICKKAPGGRRG
jgi:DNA/RNA-binding protein KIN17